MINIFFVPGMFGSTIEYVLRSYTKEYTPIKAEILSDGSMHSYLKENHPANKKNIVEFLENVSENSITTPTYPLLEAKLPEVLKVYQQADIKARNVLIYADSLRSAELNILFQYHKIAVGQQISWGLGLFTDPDNCDVRQWNANYTNWKDLRPWEFREWFSMFYVSWVKEWMQSKDQVPDDFMKVTNANVLFDTKNTLLQIIDFCGLTLDRSLDPFVQEWQHKQRYIVEEFNLLDEIVSRTMAQRDFCWYPLSIVSEAIVQQRFRDLGYEIQCHELDDFPTDSKVLYSLLERC